MIWTFQLTFDCDDPVALATFWHGALGYGPSTWTEDNAEFIETYPDVVARQGVCDDPQGHHLRLYIQKVPEPKTGPNRVRPEISVPAAVYGDEARRWEDLGARRTGHGGLRDPAGNEVEIRVEPGGGRRYMSAIVVDAVDAGEQTAFWAETLGADVVADTVRPAVAWPSSPPALRFTKAREPKRVKNRLHLDLMTAGVDDLLAEADRLCRAGATPLRPSDIGYDQDDWPDHHRVLRDPEGNELCLQAPEPATVA